MIGFLKADVSTADDQFGASVAMSAAGHVLMVGDPLESQIHDDSGAVYVFTHDGTQWNEYVTLKANFPWPNAGFGTSVSLNAAGDLLAVGAPLQRLRGVLPRLCARLHVGRHGLAGTGRTEGAARHR